MDAAQIPHRVNETTLIMACLGAKRPRHSVPPGDPISKVLGNEDLLVEVMVRLGFPTTLICAALVCKRWFCHASDPVFLRRFRKLHPPRLLGFYVNTWTEKAPHFVSMVPLPPELAPVLNRARFTLEEPVMDIRNGIVAARSYYRESLANYYPLCPERGMSSVPRFQRHRALKGNMEVVGKLVIGEEEGVGFSYWYVVLECTEERTTSTVHVYTLKDGVWCMHASVVTQLPCEPKRRPFLVGNTLYIVASSDILVIDLTTLSSSTLNLPQGLEVSGKQKGTLLSRADDHSGVYLINLNELKLCIWLHKGDKCLLVDSVCLWQMLVDLGMTDDTLKDKDITTLRLSQVGDNVEFALLKIGLCVLYLDIKYRTLRKVYDMTSDGCTFSRLHPLTMIWPPKFPVLKDEIPRHHIKMRKTFVRRSKKCLRQESSAISDSCVLTFESVIGILGTVLGFYM